MVTVYALYQGTWTLAEWDGQTSPNGFAIVMILEVPMPNGYHACFLDEIRTLEEHARHLLTL